MAKRKTKITKQEFLTWVDNYCTPTDMFTTWRNATAVDIAYQIPFDEDLALAFMNMVLHNLDKSVFDYARLGLLQYIN